MDEFYSGNPAHQHHNHSAFGSVVARGTWSLSRHTRVKPRFCPAAVLRVTPMEKPPLVLGLPRPGHQPNAKDVSNWRVQTGAGRYSRNWICSSDICQFFDLQPLK